MDGLCFWVIGGDERQRLLANLLAEDGHRVHTYGMTGEAEGLAGIGKADCVVFPLPVSRNEGLLYAPLCEEEIPLERMLEAMRPGQLLVGGQMGEEVVRQIRSRGLRWRDYFTREELAVANAVPTAEGAIQIAMERLPITLSGCRALVLGYGRIGRLLAVRLRGLGSAVTAAARRWEQLAWAEADGCQVQRMSSVYDDLGQYDIIFNTVPAVLLREEWLKKLKPGCLILDLASEPGGVDHEAARALGIETVWARGLPGKVAPVTAADVIRRTVYGILEEVPV